MEPVSVLVEPARPGRSREMAVSVEQVTGMVDRLLAQRVPPLWIQGEVSNWKRQPSGHAYFTMKDGSAQLRCMMWKRDLVRLPMEPQDGMRVLVQGQVGLYAARGEFQLTVSHLELSEEGGLWKVAFERLKRQLEVEGLLDPARKRPLPRIPRTVGIVTSPVGAALQDMLHVLGRRAPWVRVVLSPARVQGEGAANEVAAALSRLTRTASCDVVIVGRGGGSIEDLWAFNEEAVARAIAACPVPVVSAVGHETDFTIADFVADLRAPTPSSAAERVVPDTADLFRPVDRAPEQLAGSLRRLSERKQERILQQWQRLQQAMGNRSRLTEQAVLRQVAELEALSPLAALARGLSVVSNAEGRLVRTVEALKEGDALSLRLVDGTVEARVERVRPLTLEENDVR